MTEQHDDAPTAMPPKTNRGRYLREHGGVPLDHPRRCQADSSGTGEPCRKYAIRGGNVCRTHGGSAPQVIAKANERLALAADRMAMKLLNIAESENVPAYVALAAVDSALDRAGVVQPKQVQVDLDAPWAEIMGSITGIAQISQAESRAARGLPPPAAIAPAGGGDIVDAEVVPDPPSGPPNARTGGDRGDVPAQPGTGLQTMDDALEDLRRVQRRRPGR